MGQKFCSVKTSTHHRNRKHDKQKASFSDPCGAHAKASWEANFTVYLAIFPGKVARSGDKIPRIRQPVARLNKKSLDLGKLKSLDATQT